MPIQYEDFNAGYTTFKDKRHPLGSLQHSGSQSWLFLGEHVQTTWWNTCRKCTHRQWSTGGGGSTASTVHGSISGDCKGRDSTGNGCPPTNPSLTFRLVQNFAQECMCICNAPIGTHHNGLTVVMPEIACAWVWLVMQWLFCVGEIDLRVTPNCS